MASPTPHRFPFDDERPSGSVQPLSQADLQAILAHLSDNPDGLLAGTSANRPVVAVRVRASVGRPGGSAQARWRRMRATDWAVWMRSLPWRVAATLGIGVAADGVVWATSDTRLLGLGGSEVRGPRRNLHELNTDRITTVAAAGDGGLWLGTPQGLFHVDQSVLRQG